MVKCLIQGQEYVHLKIVGNHPNGGLAGRDSLISCSSALDHRMVMLPGVWTVLYSAPSAFMCLHPHIHPQCVTMWLAVALPGPGTCNGVTKKETKAKEAFLPSDLFKVFPEASPGNFCLDLIVWIWVTSTLASHPCISSCKGVWESRCFWLCTDNTIKIEYFLIREDGRMDNALETTTIRSKICCM